jgi:small subunit ribosomal protein S4
MIKQKKQYQKPKRRWDKSRIAEEKKVMKEYGLRRKRELWRVESILRNFRQQARRLAAQGDKEREKILLDKLERIGLISKGATLDDVLALGNESLLERRLQTIVFRKGFATTPIQARQFITHGHVAIDGARIRWPSAIVNKDNEKKIGFYAKSTIKDWVIKVKESGKKK